VDGSYAAQAQPFLHPGRSAVVRAGGVELGWVGDVHPLVARSWDLQDVAAFELDLDALVAQAGAIGAYEDLTSFPELREDIAIVVDADVPAARVLEVVRDAGGELLARAAVFDVYRGEQIAEGRTSLAIALTFRARDRTLADADVAPVRERIVARLADELGGELRG
jgi:phenylalanyl-tRNA synthetase beta chain